MCATRVANPFSLHEMRRLTEAVRPAAVRMPDPEARARVCRNLYGRSSKEDSMAFVNRELAIQRERASERWGFDFLKEIPRNSEKFMWCQVKSGSVPTAYALKRMTCLGSTLTVKVAVAATPAPQPATVPPSEMETASTTVSAAVSRRVSAVRSSWTDAAPKAVDRTPSPVATPTPSLKRQAQITDFMKCRKRPSTSSKEGKSAKRARLSNEHMSCSS